MSRKRKYLLFILIITFFSAGCGAYRLGTTLPSHLRTVFVPTFENTTKKTGIEVDITNAVINYFRRDGNLKPVTEEEADSVLEGTITGWTRRVLGYRGSEGDVVDEYRLYVTAKIIFRDKRNSKTLIEGQQVRGYTDFLVEGSLPESEEAAQPDAFKDLARRIVDDVVSVW